MIEIFNILTFSLLITFLFFLPLWKKNKFSNLKGTMEHYDRSVLYLLIILNLILVLLLFTLNISQIISIFYSFIFIFVIYFLINFKKFTFPKNINYNFFFFTLLLFIISIDLSNNLYLFWDSQKIWYPKAIILYNDGNISNLQNTSYAHYSFLGSLLWSFFWKISSFDHEYFGRIIYIAVYLFSLKTLLSLVDIKKSINILCLLILILITYDYWHFRGTQEILIFSFLLILFKYLYRYFIEKNNSKFNLILIFLCLNLIVWTKNEGILLSFIIIFLLIFFLKENINFKLTLLLCGFAIFFLRFISFKLFGLETNLSKDFDFLNIFDVIQNNLTLFNFILISKYIVISTLKFPHIILSLFFALLIFFEKPLLKKIIFLYIYLFISIFLIFLIYLSSPHNMEFMVSTGSLRLMFEFSSPYLFFILFYFKEKFKLK